MQRRQKRANRRQQALISRQLEIASEIGYFTDSQPKMDHESEIMVIPHRFDGSGSDSGSRESEKRDFLLTDGVDGISAGVTASGPWATGSGYRFIPLLRANPGGRLDITHAWQRVPRTIP